MLTRLKSTTLINITAKAMNIRFPCKLYSKLSRLNVLGRSYCTMFYKAGDTIVSKDVDYMEECFPKC